MHTSFFHCQQDESTPLRGWRVQDQSRVLRAFSDISFGYRLQNAPPLEKNPLCFAYPTLLVMSGGTNKMYKTSCVDRAQNLVLGESRILRFSANGSPVLKSSRFLPLCIGMRYMRLGVMERKVSLCGSVLTTGQRACAWDVSSFLAIPSITTDDNNAQRSCLHHPPPLGACVAYVLRTCDTLFSLCVAVNVTVCQHDGNRGRRRGRRRTRDPAAQRQGLGSVEGVCAGVQAIRDKIQKSEMPNRSVLASVDTLSRPCCHPER